MHQVELCPLISFILLNANALHLSELFSPYPVFPMRPDQKQVCLKVQAPTLFTRVRGTRDATPAHHAGRSHLAGFLLPKKPVYKEHVTHRSIRVLDSSRFHVTSTARKLPGQQARASTLILTTNTKKRNAGDDESLSLCAARKRISCKKPSQVVGGGIRSGGNAAPLI